MFICEENCIDDPQRYYGIARKSNGPCEQCGAVGPCLDLPPGVYKKREELPRGYWCGRKVKVHVVNPHEND